MRFVIVLVVSLCVLGAFLFSGMAAFAAQATADLKKLVEQCVKDGKALPTAKTKDNCIKEGGTWVKLGAPKIPPDPFGKSKAMPIDPYGKSKAMPNEPLGRNAQPQRGQLEGSTPKSIGGASIPGAGKLAKDPEEEEPIQARPAPERSWDPEIRPGEQGSDVLQQRQGPATMGR